jgi:hypothetical protein
LSGSHGIELVLNGLPDLRAKALEDLTLDVNELGPLGGQGGSRPWRLGEMPLGWLGGLVRL